MDSALQQRWMERYFPGTSGRVYLDTAACGPAPSGLGAAVAGFYEGPLRDGIGGRPAWRAAAEAVRARVAALIHVAPTDVEFFGNTTHVLNLVANAITWENGDEVVIAADEHPSVRHAWEGAQRAGAKLVIVPINDEAVRTQALLNALTSRTRVLAASHVHSYTGSTIDLHEMRRHTGDSRCLLIIDGIQALGAIPVDASQADVYCAATFKWLCAGFGLALMASSSKARGTMQPPFRGYTNVPPDQRLQYSHWNYPGLWALDHALTVFETFGWEHVHRAVAGNSRSLWRALSDHGFEMLGTEESLAGIVAICLQPASPGFAAALSKAGLQATVRPQALRLSAHAFVTREQIRHALDRIVRLIRAG